MLRNFHHNFPLLYSIQFSLGAGGLAIFTVPHFCCGFVIYLVFTAFLQTFPESFFKFYGEVLQAESWSLHLPYDKLRNFSIRKKI